MTDIPRAYFEPVEGGFMPTRAAVGPWNPNDLSGVALGGLLAHVTDLAMAEHGSAGGPEMTVARLVIDILGTAPTTLLEPRTRVLREGRRIRMIESELWVDGRVAARGTALIARQKDTIAWETPLPHPLPRDVAVSKPSGNPVLGKVIERRIVHGSYRKPGPGAMWVKFDIQMAGGTPMSPLVRSAMLGDMGSAIGSSFPVKDWTFPNLDISIHFLRMPRGDWVLLESQTDGAGNGIAIVSSTFMDADGIYARGHQTLFLEPRI